MSENQIAVYGATGYTGRLIAAELKRAGASVVLAGRDKSKLERLAGDLSLETPVRVASVNDSPALAKLLADAACVINCAGPFTLFGEPVVAAAIETGTHYMDTTGEQQFVKRVFDRYEGPAKQAGVAVVCAMGFDIVLGDMGAQLAAAGLGHLDELVIAYSLDHIAASRGSMLTALQVMRGGGVVYHDGALRRAPAFSKPRAVRFEAPLGEQRCLPFPGIETVTVPRHVDAASVEVLMSVRTLAPHPLLERGMPWLTPTASLAMKTPIRSLLERAIGRLPEGPSEEQRNATTIEVVVEARGPAGARRVVLKTNDTYAFTAASCAHAAQLQARPDYKRSGVLAPAQAFRPRPFLDYLDQHGLTVETG